MRDRDVACQQPVGCGMLACSDQETPRLRLTDMSTASSPSRNDRSAIQQLGILVAYLVLGATGGILGGLLLNRFERQFVVETPDDLKPVLGIYTPQQFARIVNEQRHADHKNLPLSLGLMGSMITGALALAIGGNSGSPRVAARGLLAGLLLGALLAAMGAVLSIAAREALRGWNTLDAQGEPHLLKSQIHTISHQAPTWLGIAAAIGLSTWVTTGCPHRARRLAGVSTLGALLMLLCFPVLASAIHIQDTAGIIPQGWFNQAGWSVLGGLLLGFVIGRSMLHHPGEA
jgi:hypothetical protein